MPGTWRAHRPVQSSSRVRAKVSRAQKDLMREMVKRDGERRRASRCRDSARARARSFLCSSTTLLMRCLRRKQKAVKCMPKWPPAPSVGTSQVCAPQPLAWWVPGLGLLLHPAATRLTVEWGRVLLSFSVHLRRLIRSLLLQPLHLPLQRLLLPHEDLYLLRRLWLREVAADGGGEGGSGLCRWNSRLAMQR